MREIRAFISYRRRDAFVVTPGASELSFLAKLKQALLDLGFIEVFLDVDKRDENATIKAGDHFESRTHKWISNCDLVVAPVGASWLEILRTKSSKVDMLAREIRASLAHEKIILPVLVDGATMPEPEELPEDIRRFAFYDAVSVNSSASTEVIKSALESARDAVMRDRRLGSGFALSYWIFSITAWCLCAIAPHAVGIYDYGLHPWLGMAEVWSGFFVWPIFYLPFALLALRRPLGVLVECLMNAPRRRSFVTYLTPLIVGTFIALLGVGVEVVSKYQVPWSIKPALECSNSAVPADPLLKKYAPLATYDSDNSLARKYDAPPFWLIDKCWPAAFFFLTVPIYEGIADHAYRNERQKLQPLFLSILKSENHAPLSISNVPYVISFSILIWLAAVGITLTIFFITVKIRRDDDTVRELPSEDAYLCLMFALVTFAAWIPFRMHTIYFKNLYFCLDPANCPGALARYWNDVVLGMTFLIGYVFLGVSLLVKYRRLVVGLLGLLAVLLIGVVAVGVFYFSEKLAPLTATWQFYVGLSIPAILILLALWYQFDPAIVRFNDFRKEIK